MKEKNKISYGNEILPGYARISDLLARYQDFSHIPQDIFEAKRLIGTEVHEAIRLDHTGFLIPMSDRAWPYFESYDKWKKSMNGEIVYSEQRFYCDNWKITGQVDALIKLPGDEKFTLIDYKTSHSENKKMWPLQGHFYHMLASNLFELTSQVIFIKLDKSGKNPKIFTYDINEKHKKICESILQIHKYLL